MLIALHTIFSLCVLLTALQRSTLLERFSQWLFLPDYEEQTAAPLGSGAMFDRIAPVYDTANKYMSFGLDRSWREQLVRRMVWEEERAAEGNYATSTVGPILDISTGTGDVAILQAQEIRTRGLRTHVIALDPSEGMLGYADKKLTGLGLGGLVRLIPSGAESMPLLANGSIMQMTISFGIRNFLKRAQALVEMRRVLSSEGQLYVLEFFAPRSHTSLLTPIAALFLKHILPKIGLLVSGGAREEYQHLSRSILRFPSPSAFAGELEAAGFGSCSDSDLFFDIVHLVACSPPRIVLGRSEAVGGS